MGSAKETVTELLSLADIKVDGKRQGDIRVNDERVYSRILNGGSLALGESYMDGWWDAQNLDVFFYKLLGSHLDKKAKISPRIASHLIRSSLLNLQTKHLAKRNTERHYDIGNDLYEVMLDPTMTYSCGYWKNAKTLQAAQEAKYDLICRKLHLKKGMTVLDIGCGWGGFAIYAAKNYGVKVVGVTLAKEQVKLAKERCKKLPIKIELKDYRDVKGTFDRIVSIGMFEHVGVKNYKKFFKVCKKVLKKDGLMLLHTIGKNDTRQTWDPWLATYIFPNGMLPSAQNITKASEKLFLLEDWHNFGVYYDKTLMAWHNNFEKDKHKLPKKYDARFARMWKYYLMCCAGSFRCRKIHAWQIVLSPRGISKGYDSVR